jgi:macrolide-specific efflux system membrane fusion protein
LPENEPAIAVSQSNSLAEQSETALVPSTLPTAALMVPTAPPPDDEKRKVRRRRAALVTVAAILAVIALIFAITSILSSNVQAAGQLQPMQSVDLNFQSTAPIESVSVAPGQSVHKGEALATQSSTALTAQYAADVTKLKAAQVALATGPAPNQTPAQLQAAVAQAQAALTTAQTKASSEANLDGIAVANANSQITSAQSTLATDESSVTSACSPGPQGSTDGCDTAEHQLGVDQAALTSAQGALHLAQQTQSTDAANSQASIAQAQSALATAQADEAAGTQPQSQSQESTEQAAVNAAQAAVAADQKAIDATQIYAPFSGIVAAVNGTVGDLAGPTGIQQSSSPAGVSSGTSSGIQIFPQAPVNSNSKTPQQLSLITLNTRAMNVVVQIGESDISNIHVGEGATVTFPAQSGAVYQAKVSYIEPSAVNDNGKVYFLVHLVLVSSKGRPVPAPSRLSGLSGLTADVTFT